MRPSFLLLSLFAAGLCQGAVYKWMDDQGAVHYSDHPVPDAQELNVPGETPAPAAAAASEAESESGAGLSAGEDPEADAYAQFEILEPAENQTFRSDAGEVSISLLLEPALREDHRIKLTLDGTAVETRFATTQVILRKVRRGTHRLEAAVVDAEGQELATATANFHMRRSAAEEPQADSPDS